MITFFKKNSFRLLIAAPCVGFGFALLILFIARNTQPTVQGSPWKTFLNIGSDGESVLQKAIRAGVGIYALPKEEVVYFMANTDEEGNRLEAGHRYRISGNAPFTRIWSITLYDGDHRLSANPIERYHINGSVMNTKQGQPYSFIISSKEENDYWLPAPEKGNIVLCYRIYLPPASTFPIQASQLPRIQKL